MYKKFNRVLKLQRYKDVNEGRDNMSSFEMDPAVAVLVAMLDALDG